MAHFHALWNSTNQVSQSTAEALPKNPPTHSSLNSCSNKERPASSKASSKGQLLGQFTPCSFTRSVSDSTSNIRSKHGHDRLDTSLWLLSGQQAWEESSDPSTVVNSHRQPDNHCLTFADQHKKIALNVHQQQIMQHDVKDYNDPWTKWKSMHVFYSRVKLWPLENHITWTASASLIMHTML